jgi:hypothetical protein
VSVEAFLSQRAVSITVSGSYTLPNWLDPQGCPRAFACRTSRVSPFRMTVDVPVIGRVGDRITSSFGDLGTLHGQISDISPGGFLLELEMAAAMREKLSNSLKWLEKKQTNAKLIDARRQVRVLPAKPHSVITFADGTSEKCFVIDMSVSGAAVSAVSQPTIGTPLAVGACIGRVVRHLPHGFAIQFVEPQTRSELDRRLSQTVLPHTGRSASHSHEARKLAAMPSASLSSESRSPTSSDVYYL